MVGEQEEEKKKHVCEGLVAGGHSTLLLTRKESEKTQQWEDKMVGEQEEVKKTHTYEGLVAGGHSTLLLTRTRK